MRQAEIEAGARYVGKAGSPRVVRRIEDGRVLYDTDAGDARSCTLKAFAGWAQERKSNAKTHPDYAKVKREVRVEKGILDRMRRLATEPIALRAKERYRDFAVKRVTGGLARIESGRENRWRMPGNPANDVFYAARAHVKRVARRHAANKVARRQRRANRLSANGQH